MKKAIVFIIIVSLLISGCQLAEGKIEASDSAADELIVTADPVTTSNSIDTEPSETSVITQAPTSEVIAETSFPSNYDFVPMDLDYDFEDVMNICSDYTGVEISNYSSDVINTIDVNDHHILYIPDYVQHLNDLIEISPEGAADDLPECEYHVLRAMSVDGICIYEFDDAYWAGVSYSIFVESAVSSNIETIDSSYLDGYCFAYDTSIQNVRRYIVRCYFGNCILAYDYNVNTGHTNEYEKYLELCNVLGLPTSDQITDIVLHN